MKLVVSILISSFSFCILGCSTHSLYTNTPTWQDEFSGKGTPNMEMWSRSVTKPGSQLSAYCDSDSNAYVENGMLHLRIIKSNNTEMPYTAGRIIANKKYHFKKGKLEVRAKAPLSKGVWPAIWLNGPKTQDGYFAELDLMEHVYAMGDSCYEAVYHLWGDFEGEKHNHQSYGQIVPVNVGEWHIYTLEILDNQIIMSVDGKAYYIIKKGQYGSEWPENQEYSLRLAMAYGGYGSTKFGIDDSSLPAEMLVDYVRYYELKKK